MKQAENRSARQVTLHLTLPILVTLTLLTAAFSTGSPVFLMPALLIALLGFVSSMAMAKFLLRGEVIE